MNYWDILLAEKFKKDPPLPPIPDNAYLLEQATGDVITLTDAAALPMPKAQTTLQPIQDLHGYDYPWVGGAGKNKFDMQNLSSGNVTVTNGVATGTAVDFTTEFGTNGIQVNESGQLAFSCDIYTDGNAGTSGGGLRFIFVYTDNTKSYAGTANNAMTTITRISGISETGKTVSSITMSYGSNGSNTWHISNVQLEQGTQATSYAPYSNICPISGYDGAEYTRTGVNVWDEQWEVGAYDTAGEPTALNTVRCKNYITIVPNTTYYMRALSGSFYVCWYDVNKQFISRTQEIVHNNTTTSPNNAYYMRYNMGGGYGNTYNHDICINVSNPTINGNYYPYQGQAVTLTFDNTIYSGTVDWCTGLVTVDTAMVDLGTKNYNKGVISNYTFFYTGISNKLKNVLCSGYKAVIKNRAELNNGEIGTWNTVNSFEPCIRDDSKADLTEGQFKTAMSGVQLLYELSTPITYQLTPTQLTTLAGYNTIYTDIGNISLEYWTKEVRA